MHLANFERLADNVGLLRTILTLIEYWQILYTMLLLGIVGAGGRFTGSNPAYMSSELLHHLRITKTRYLITDPELLSRVALTSDLPALNVFVLDISTQEIHAGQRSWNELLQHGEADWVKFKDADEAKETTAVLLSTSGTSGHPKAAMISHYNCIMQNIMLDDTKRKPYNASLLHYEASYSKLADLC